MVRTLTGLVMALFVLLSGEPAWAEAVTLEEQDLTPWQGFWQEMFPGESLEDFLRAVTDGEQPEIGHRMRMILERQGAELPRRLLKSMTALTALAVLERLIALPGAARSGPGKITVRAAAVLLVGERCLAALRVALAALERLSGFVAAAIPVLTPLMAAAGWTAAAGLLQPASLALTALVDTWLRIAMGRAVSGAMMLCLAGSLAEDSPLTGVVRLIAKGVQWFLGLMLTGYGAVVGIQASALLNYDSMALKAARYTVDSALPGIGGLFADLVDTATVSAGMIRSSLGVASLLTLTAVCLGPVMELLMTVLPLSLAGALGSVLGEGRLGALYRDMAALAKLLLEGVLAAAILAGTVLSLACLAGGGG